MASHTHPDAVASNPETPITIKVVFEGSNRKFKLPLQDLGPAVFAEKVRSILQIPQGQLFVLERFSDSGNAYITLDQSNSSAYKQLYRAAKAKLKLRIRATLLNHNTSILVKQESHRHEHLPQAPTSPPLATQLSHAYSMAANGRPVEPNGTVGARDFSCVQARDQFFEQLANISKERDTGRHTKEAPAQFPSSFWQIFCNNCDKPMSDAHFHCSICDGGDYDLCEACVETGKICPGEGHWLIKRFIKSGKVVTSATETVPPKLRETVQSIRETPVPTKADIKPQLPKEANRTCNSCVSVLPESALVTCQDCPDYDLCFTCFKTEQGHHPAHSFAATDKATVLTKDIATICAPGRNIRHHALCDGCDEPIFGIRHKCLQCPDFDLCPKCFQNKRSTHDGHRFVPVYENLAAASRSRSVHHGILCDGPLCNNKSGKAYIRGIRYKCAVCSDFDLCMNCEAHPNNKHNETHPLIKFKTPVRAAHVTLIDEAAGRPRQVTGDAVRPKTQMSPSFRPVASLPPYTFQAAPKPVVATQSVASQTKPEETMVGGGIEQSLVDLDAHFVHDRIADGTRKEAGEVFYQAWTMKNPGPKPWPVGSVVQFVGGDKMLYEDINRPLVIESNATYNTVRPGDHFEFRVTMRAPSRVGKHISYWRLKAPNGAAFGHKLWCDIEVVPKPVARQMSTTSLADYQIQLMLLEQQNKKRYRASMQQKVIPPVDAVSAEVASPPTAAAVPASEATTEKIEDKSLASSTMVFPTLVKESPSSSTLRESTHEATTPVVPKVEGPKSDAAVTEAETVSTTTTVLEAEAEERFEDLESVEYHDSDDDDGFLTDEEYDILDASDEETSRRVL